MTCTGAHVPAHCTIAHAHANFCVQVKHATHIIIAQGQVTTQLRYSHPFGPSLMTTRKPSSPRPSAHRHTRTQAHAHMTMHAQLHIHHNHIGTCFRRYNRMMQQPHERREGTTATHVTIRYVLPGYCLDIVHAHMDIPVRAIPQQWMPSAFNTALTLFGNVLSNIHEVSEKCLVGLRGLAQASQARPLLGNHLFAKAGTSSMYALSATCMYS